MKFNKLGLVCASLAVSLVGMGINSSSAQAGTFSSRPDFFGEDLRHFKSDKVTDAPTLGESIGNYNPNKVTKNSNLGQLTESTKAERNFLNELDNMNATYATVNFEAEEGFTKLGKTGNSFGYDVNLTNTDGTSLGMRIFDENVIKVTENDPTGTKLHTSIEDTEGDVTGGRYGISDNGATKEERDRNQFLNTNAGKDSNLTFSFTEAISAFGFFGTDFERGGVMGYELTRVDGSTEYIQLNLSDPKDYNKRKYDKTIRGTAFYSGYIADSVDEYFTQVRFDVSDTKKGTNDMVAFDRMTFASPTLKEGFVTQVKEVPEPGTGILALGAVVSGVAFKKRKKK